MYSVYNNKSDNVFVSLELRKNQMLELRKNKMSNNYS